MDGTNYQKIRIWRVMAISQLTPKLCLSPKIFGVTDDSPEIFFHHVYIDKRRYSS